MTINVFSNYDDWVAQVPISIKQDLLWEMDVYRKALLISDLVWIDCETLLAHALGKPIADQLLRCGGSVAANMEEGYGRGFGNDYARFLRIALGSAREARGWYYRGRRLLKPEVIDHRMHLLDTIIAGLVTMANQQRKYK